MTLHKYEKLFVDIIFLFESVKISHIEQLVLRQDSRLKCARSLSDSDSKFDHGSPNQGHHWIALDLQMIFLGSRISVA